uniref:hypothetical protein n=1 Tax=Candidatus Ichthyocystis hellenicum TaxID=1561003 RepID=UPI000A869D7D
LFMFFNLIALTRGDDIPLNSDYYNFRSQHNQHRIFLCALEAYEHSIVAAMPLSSRGAYSSGSKNFDIRNQIIRIIENSNPRLWARYLSELRMIWEPKLKMYSEDTYNKVVTMLSSSFRELKANHEICPRVDRYITRMYEIINGKIAESTTTLRSTLPSTTTTTLRSTLPSTTTTLRSVLPSTTTTTLRSTFPSTTTTTLRSTFPSTTTTTLRSTTSSITSMHSTATDLGSAAPTTTVSTIDILDTTIEADPTDPIFSTDNILLLVTCFLSVFSLILLVVFFKSNNKTIVRTRKSLHSGVRRLFGLKDLSSESRVGSTNRANDIEMVDMRDVSTTRCLLRDELTEVLVEEEDRMVSYDSDFDDDSDDDQEPLYVNLDY